MMRFASVTVVDAMPRPKPLTGLTADGGYAGSMAGLMAGFELAWL